MKEYFISKNNKKLGPFTIEELQEEGIDMNTLVWKHGMSDWKKANEFEELQDMLSKTPPPIPSKQQLPFLKYLMKNVIFIIVLFVLGIIIGFYVQGLSYDLIMDNYGKQGIFGTQTTKGMLMKQLE